MKSRLYYAVICYILAAVLLFLCVPIVHRISYPKTQVIRTVKALEKGEQITGEDVEEVTIGALHLPDDVIETAEDALGRYAAVDIVEGDILYLSKLSQLPMEGDVPKDILPAENSVALLRLKMMEGSEYPLPEMGDVIKLNLFGKKLTDIPELQFVRVLSVIPRETGEEVIWESGQTLSTSEVKVLLERNRPWNVSALQTLLNRLIDRRFLETYKEGNYNSSGRKGHASSFFKKSIKYSV